MPNDASLGRILKERRRALDLTQAELARRVGCAVVTIKKLEADDVRPSRQIADATTGAELHQFIGHRDIAWSVEFSPDGKYLVSGSSDRTARLWNVETGAELRRFAGHAGGLFSVGFSPDGRRVITGSIDGTALLWDVDIDDTVAALCSRLLRDFTPEERAQYGIPDDGPTCAAGR
jgi:WD40 repeat protein